MPRTPKAIKLPLVRSGLGLIRLAVALCLLASCFALALPTAPASAQAPAPVAEGDGLLTYGVASNTTPQWRSFDNTANTLSAATPSVAGTTPLHSKMATSPIKREAIAGSNSGTGLLQIMCFDGLTWTNEWSISVGGSGQTPRFNIAYERTSGDVMVLYSSNIVSGTNAMTYRTKPGSSGCGSGWSSPTYLSSATTTNTIQWVKMASDNRTGSDLVTAIFADSSSKLSAKIWDGSTWGNEPASLETSLEYLSGQHDVENFDVEYESLSGDAVVVWGNSAGAEGTDGFRYATCVGGTASCTWTKFGSTTTFADDIHQIDLAPNPLSDEMVVASTGAGGEDLQAGYWSGSGWTTTPNLDTSTTAPLGFRQRVAVGYLVFGNVSRSIVTFSDASATSIRYYLSTVGAPGNFGTPDSPLDYATTPALQLPQNKYNVMVNPANPAQAQVTISDNANDLFMKRVSMAPDGAVSWSQSDGGSAIETNLANLQAFAFAHWRNVSMSVDARVSVNPAYSFSVVNSTTSCNGEPNYLSGAGSSTAVDLSNLTAAGSVSGGQTLAVAGNAGGGFRVYIRGNYATQNFRSPYYSWTDVTGTYGAAQVLGSGEKFGYTFVDSTASSAVVNPSVSTFVALDATDRAIMGSNTSLTGTGCVSFTAQSSAATPAGNYEAIVHYSAVPSF